MLASEAVHVSDHILLKDSGFAPTTSNRAEGRLSEVLLQDGLQSTLGGD